MKHLLPIMLIVPLFLAFSSGNAPRFDFSKNDELGWNAINDDVMGGISKGEVSYGKRDILIWEGQLSLANNGGFSSVRSPKMDYDFSEFRGLKIRIKTDGHAYGFTLSTNYYFTGYSYNHPIEANQGEWTIVEVPFSEFNQTYFGQTIPKNRMRPLDPAGIKQVGVILADKNTAPFRAEIDWIDLY